MMNMLCKFAQTVPSLRTGESSQWELSESCHLIGLLCFELLPCLSDLSMNYHLVVCSTLVYPNDLAWQVQISLLSGFGTLFIILENRPAIPLFMFLFPRHTMPTKGTVIQYPDFLMMHVDSCVSLMDLLIPCMCWIGLQVFHKWIIKCVPNTNTVKGVCEKTHSGSLTVWHDSHSALFLYKT